MLFVVAGVTGLEPAASGVTGRRSNQTELHPPFLISLQTQIQMVKKRNYLWFENTNFDFPKIINSNNNPNSNVEISVLVKKGIANKKQANIPFKSLV